MRTIRTMFWILLLFAAFSVVSVASAKEKPFALNQGEVLPQGMQREHCGWLHLSEVAMDNDITVSGPKNFRNIPAGVPLVLDRKACREAPSKTVAAASRREILEDIQVGLALAKKNKTKSASATARVVQGEVVGRVPTKSASVSGPSVSEVRLQAQIEVNQAKLEATRAKEEELRKEIEIAGITKQDRELRAQIEAISAKLEASRKRGTLLEAEVGVVNAEIAQLKSASNAQAKPIQATVREQELTAQLKATTAKAATLEQAVKDGATLRAQLDAAHAEIGRSKAADNALQARVEQAQARIAELEGIVRNGATLRVQLDAAKAELAKFKVSDSASRSAARVPPTLNLPSIREADLEVEVERLQRNNSDLKTQNAILKDSAASKSDEATLNQLNFVRDQLAGFRWEEFKNVAFAIGAAVLVMLALALLLRRMENGFHARDVLEFTENNRDLKKKLAVATRALTDVQSRIATLGVFDPTVTIDDDGGMKRVFTRIGGELKEGLDIGFDWRYACSNCHEPVTVTSNDGARSVVAQLTEHVRDCPVGKPFIVSPPDAATPVSVAV